MLTKEEVAMIESGGVDLDEEVIGFEERRGMVYDFEAVMA